MKKRYFLALVIFAAIVSNTVEASCESIKASINRKIINNGVKESDFTLEIIPNDQVGPKDKIVGYCDKNKKKIIYKKNPSVRSKIDNNKSKLDNEKNKLLDKDNIKLDNGSNKLDNDSSKLDDASLENIL